MLRLRWCMLAIIVLTAVCAAEEVQVNARAEAGPAEIVSLTSHTLYLSKDIKNSSDTVVLCSNQDESAMFFETVAISPGQPAEDTLLVRLEILHTNSSGTFEVYETETCSYLYMGKNFTCAQRFDFSRGMPLSAQGAWYTARAWVSGADKPVQKDFFAYHGLCRAYENHRFRITDRGSTALHASLGFNISVRFWGERDEDCALRITESAFGERPFNVAGHEPVMFYRISHTGNLAAATGRTRILIKYNTSALERLGLDEDTMRLFWYNGTGFSAVSRQSIDAKTDELSAEPESLGYFGLFAQPHRPIVPCVEDWVCTGWGACNDDGIRRRVCFDFNSCGTEENRPSTSTECRKQPDPKNWNKPAAEEQPASSQQQAEDAGPPGKFNLFDIGLELMGSGQVTGDSMLVKVFLINFGDPGKTPVNMTYAVIDSRNIQVYHEVENLTVMTQTEFLKELPATGLADGSYRLIAVLTYPGQKYPAQGFLDFEVARTKKRLDYVMIGYLTVFFSAVLGLLIRYRFLDSREREAQAKAI